MALPPGNFGNANNIINESATVIFQAAGITDRFTDFGNVVKVTGSLGVSMKEAYWSQNGLLVLAKEVVTTIKPEFTLECNEMNWKNLYQIYGATSSSVFTQTAVATATITVTNAAPFDVIKIPGINPTIISIMQSSTPLVLGVDYDIVGGSLDLSKSNCIRFREGSTLVTGSASVVITYSLPAITNTTAPSVMVMDMWNNMNKSGYAEISFTDQYSSMFNHRITGNCFLSPSKISDYAPDNLFTAEFKISFAGAGQMFKVDA